MSKALERSADVMPTVEEDKAIIAAAGRDPDAQPLTPKQRKSLVPMPALRGRPKSENKKLLVAMRYGPKVVAHFKSTGEGRQSRMGSVLCRYVKSHTRPAGK